MPPLNIAKIAKDADEKSLPASPSVQHSLCGVGVAEPIMEEDEDDLEDWEDDEEELQILEPPDGGWGWVIVAASFLCNVVVDGIAYTFGILFMEFVTYYQAPKGKTAWVGSLLSGCYLSAGPIVSALTNRFGCRPVTMAGSVIACVAFVLSTFAPTVDILMITYGIMGGIGFGLIYLPAIVSVGYYFSTKRAFATGIAVCGSGVGAFVLAPVCEKLLDAYGWKGTLLVMAGLSLNCMVFGALMRPLEANASNRTKPLLQRIAEEKERQRQASLCNSQFFMVQHADGTVEKRPKVLLNMEPGVHSTLNLDQFGKSPADTPIITLSPIEEARKSPASSKEDEPDDKEPLADKEAAAKVADANAKDVKETATSQNASTLTVNGHPQPNGGPILGIREIAKRKGLLTSSRSGMKISVSNITVNSELRKHSAPAVQLSSSGYLCPGNRNNNYLVEEVWKKLKEEQLPLDGSRLVHRRPSKKDFARPMYRKDIFYSGSIRNLPEYNSSKDVRSYMTSVVSIPRDVAPVVTSTVDAGNGDKAQESGTTCFRLPKSMTDTIKETLNFSLLLNPVFLLICISNIFGMLGFYIPYVYITDSATMRGIPLDQAAFLLSIIGITNTFGRLLFGWLSDRRWVDTLLVNNICLTLSGLCILAIPLCGSYTALVADCILFGLFVSAYICLTSIILVDLLGLDSLTNAFGILSLFRGGASIIGPPIAGSIYDMTGSYDIPFFVSGALLVFSAMLSFLVPLVRRWQDSRRTSVSQAGGDPEEDEDEELDQDHQVNSGNSEIANGTAQDPAVDQIVSVV